ncbi:MAG: DNA polymerase I [Spirochaetaceae bacterium]|jgi:DNA polymerase-1|nr:DNA polymerase I [Spirochaetaceae bacterium]
MKNPLYIIDAYALIYRSYFAFISKPLRNPVGKNVSALYGFTRTVVSLIDGIKTPCLVAAFDSRTPTFRHKKYPLYKATRQKAPEDLHEQVPIIKDFLQALGITVLQKDNYEADDIIATAAQLCKKEKRECYVITGDKDLLQIVGDGVFQFRPAKNSTRDTNFSYEKIGYDEVKAEWGVEPEKILDLLSLTGDTSDNIPGVKGIGEKTAVKLISRWGSLDEIYKNISAIEGINGTKLASGKESAYLSKELITLVNDVPLEINSIDDFSTTNLNRGAAAIFLYSQGIPSLAKELDSKKTNTVKGEQPEPSPVTLTAGDYKCITTLEAAQELFDIARNKKYIALDFETDSLNVLTAHPVGLSVALKEGEAYYLPITAHNGNPLFLDGEQIKKMLTPLFSDPAMTIIAHNAKFDYQIARMWGFERFKCKIWDTMIAAWLCNPESSSYSLEALSQNYLGLKGLSFSEIVPKGGIFSDVPLETAVRYSSEDSDFCLRLKTFFEKALKDQNAEKLFYELEMHILPILSEMELTGIKIDTALLRSYGVELSIDLDKIQSQTWEATGHEFNLASPKQLQEVLFNERGLKTGKKTKTGFSTDVAVLEELAHIDIVPELILRHRKLAKLKSTYVDTLADMADSNGRLHTSFMQTGTATGRLSSREPNLQNIPIREDEGRRIREAFITSDGNLLISADYSQIELVVLAHLSGDLALKEAFLSGKDVHVRTAALIFGIPEDKVDPAQRRIAKTINFGVMYGMSSFRLSSELNISRNDAATFIESYFKTYSGVREFIDKLILDAEKTGYVSTLFGRRRAIPTINSVNKTEKSAAQRVAVNTPIQGSAADIVKKAMIDLDAALAHNTAVKLLLQVHDELILECPADEAKAAASLVRNVMENAVTLSIPLRVSIETGPRWGSFH